MAVHFVYRSGYENPLGHRLESYEDADMLSWFQRNWLQMEDVPSDKVDWTQTVDGKTHLEIDDEFLAERTDRILGRFVYGFWVVWTSMLQTSSPKTTAELKTWLESVPYPEGEVFAIDHALQAYTDDDERDLAVMMFDDAFAKEHPERTALFLHNKLDLPVTTDATNSKFCWNGTSQLLNSESTTDLTTYCILLVIEDSAWLSPPKGVFEFSGIRLDQLADCLRCAEPRNHSEWPAELRMLRYLAVHDRDLSTTAVLKKMLRYEPFENAELFDSWANGKQQEKRFLGSREEMINDFSEIADRLKNPESANQTHSSQFSEHFVRFGFHIENDTDFRDSFHLSMYFFDCEWAKSHPDLALSLLNYGAQGMCLFDLPNREWQ